MINEYLMARTKDPSRLSNYEGRDFRQLVRKVRTLKGITNAMIAVSLDWELKTLENLLCEGRPLIAEKAFVIHRVLASLPARNRTMSSRIEADSILLQYNHQAKWWNSYRAALSSTPVVIPPAQVERLAEKLVSDAARTQGVGKAAQAAMEKSIRRTLRRDGAKMAIAWYETTGSDIQRHIVSLEGKPWPSHPDIDDILKLPPSQFAYEIVYIAAVYGFEEGGGDEKL